MDNGGEIGGVGGGSLEHPRQCQGTQRAGLFLGGPSCAEPPGAPRGGAGAELGRCQGGTLTMRRGMVRGEEAADLVRVGVRVRVRAKVSG